MSENASRGHSTAFLEGRQLGSSQAVKYVHGVFLYAPNAAVVYMLGCPTPAAPLQVCQIPPRPFSGRGSQDDLRRTQMGQESLRTALQDPHKLPEDPERPQEASKKPPRGSQEVTRRPQDDPQGLPRNRNRSTTLCRFN